MSYAWVIRLGAAPQLDSTVDDIVFFFFSAAGNNVLGINIDD